MAVRVALEHKRQRRLIDFSSQQFQISTQAAQIDVLLVGQGLFQRHGRPTHYGISPELQRLGICAALNRCL